MAGKLLRSTLPSAHYISFIFPGKKKKVIPLGHLLFFFFSISGKNLYFVYFSGILTCRLRLTEDHFLPVPLKIPAGFIFCKRLSAAKQTPSLCLPPAPCLLVKKKGPLAL